MTKAELDLISYVNMYLLFEKGIRSGVSYISKRQSKESNKYLRSYNPKKPANYIIYFNKNNLYGYVMPKSLPTGGFKLVDLAQFNLDKYNYDSLRGCFLEIDIGYTK